MTHQIFSFQFNHGGIQDQLPAMSLPNQSFESDPVSLFESWITTEDSSEHHQSLFPSYSDDEYYRPIHHQNLISAAPQGISEVNDFRQVLLDNSDEPINGNHEISISNSNSDSASASFDLLRGDTNGSRKRSSSCTVYNPISSVIDSEGLSIEELIRIAGARFIHFSSESGDSVSDSFDFDLSFSGLSDDELKNVELAEFLLMAAEKIGDEQYDRASSLLTECDLQSSASGDPVQRLVYYFSRALWERIDGQTGKRTVMQKPDKVQAMMMPPRDCFLEFYEKVPFGQVSEFAAIQAVVDSVASSRRIHIVDFNIKNGEQWTIFMQALVSREEIPVDHLKITAIGTVGKGMLEETGKRLIGFAEAMELSFSFKLIMVEDLMDLKEEMFEIDCDETVAVLSEYLLTTLISSAAKLDYVMKLIWKIKPCVMVVTEVESNHNSPVFVNRFIETLFFVSAYFDCLETCMDRESPHRMFIESTIFGEGTKIIVAKEGEERGIRNVKVDVWRAYFRRFGMEEAELSLSCVYQAELVAKKFKSWRSCTVELDDKSLIVGWKGTPIHSITAWNFNYE
ncbi:DELLA protein RGL2 [Linum perenne]